jgi:hypothetical protein
MECSRSGGPFVGENYKVSDNGHKMAKKYRDEEKLDRISRTRDETGQGEAGHECYIDMTQWVD